MGLSLVKSEEKRPTWRDFVGGSTAADVEAVLRQFPSGTDIAVMQVVQHCYRVRPPGVIIRTAVVRWLEDWTHEDIVAAAYLTGLQSPGNPVAYLDAILRRWKTGAPAPRKNTTAGCAGCGGDLGLDYAGYQGRKYCASCWEKQAWRNHHDQP